MIVILGAGLIGLSIAYELARRGATVRVFDQAAPAAAASWAGAGMLAPDSEDSASDALRTLCALSLARFPAFVAGLAADGGVDARLRLDGILTLATSPADAERLRERAAHLNGCGVDARMLSRAESLALEPAAGPAVSGALFVAGEGVVDNRRLGRALLAACARRGVVVRGTCGSLAVEADERRVRGVQTGDGFLAAECVINAAGAWAADVRGVPAHARVAVRPVKGQMLALATPRGFVRRALWYPGGYAVPRDDGRLLLGATTEDAGFDVRVTAGGVRALLDAALAALPALRDFTLSETWAGLRPGSADGVPYIGLGALEGYAVASGHYRNGILLAPATAELLADLIEGRPPAIDPAPFAPGRADAAAARRTVPT
jgi:glycine oxidase